VDLTPTAVAPPRRRNRTAYVVIAVVVVVLGVVVYQALTSASLYFYNADEAVAQRDELGDKRFRLQGTVLGGYDTDAQPFEFTVAFNGERVVVHHDGDPPDTFAAGLPVVLEGRWSEQGDWFDSDRVLVKHSAEYEADNGDRLEDARRGGTSTSEP
jgi:cytochrome c-type biogenesis protein CcmE